MKAGPYILAALIAVAVILWWISRAEADVPPGPEPPGPEPSPDLGDLTKLPNYRPPEDGRRTFLDHEDFVRTLDSAFIDRFPQRGARGLIIAHAATAGWHIPGRAPLYHWSLWGQLATEAQIRAGVSFTILRAPGGAWWPYRAFSTPREALDAYLANVEAYGTGGVGYLDGRGAGLALAECQRYAELIRQWFAVSQRTPEALTEKAHEWDWIWRNKIRPVV